MLHLLLAEVRSLFHIKRFNTSISVKKNRCMAQSWASIVIKITWGGTSVGPPQRCNSCFDVSGRDLPAFSLICLVLPALPPAADAQHDARLTWITRMFSPVSWASCSRMCRVGFGVATNAAFNVSSCLALMVVRGPRLFVPEFCSSFSILFVSLSDDVELSVSFMSSCVGSCRSGDKLRSVHDDTGEGNNREESWSEMSTWRRRRAGEGLLCSKAVPVNCLIIVVA